MTNPLKLRVVFLTCLFATTTFFLSSLSATAMTADEKQCAATNAKSIAACTRLIGRTPLPIKRAVYLNNRALAYLQEKQCTKAIADFEEAIRIYPVGGDEGFHYDLHLRLGGIWSDCAADQEKAIAIFNKAILLVPKWADAYVNRGQAKIELGDLQGALDDIQIGMKLADVEQAKGRYWNLIGLIHRDMGRLDDAVAAYDAALKADSKCGNCVSNRGEAWRLKGDLDRALSDANRAVALDNKNPVVYVLRGDTLRYRNELIPAIADYQSALKLLPDYIPAHTGLGLSYERMRDFQRAKASFQASVDSRLAVNAVDISKSTLETARARLLALASGETQPVIPAAPTKAANATSLPTPAVVAPKVIKAAEGSDRRVALVVGNSTYSTVSALRNPKNDADAMAKSLRNIGFETVSLTNDATREQLINALRTFANEAEKADWAVVYYAGHGMEVGGTNYLVPVDAKLAVDRDIQFEAVPLDQVLAAVDSAKKLKLVILDACRDNPFQPRKTNATEAIARATGGAQIASRSTGRGLAEVKVTGATLVVYAAKNGQVALDGEGDNSPFAVAIVQRLATPGVEINKLFRLVRDDVMEATAGRQEPYTYGSLPGREDFFFVSK